MKKTLIFIMVLLLTTAVGGVNAKTLVLKAGHSNPPSHPMHVQAEELASYVKEKTGGRIEVEIFPNEMLGSDKQMLEQLRMGALDIHIAPQGVVSAYTPKLAAIGLPFLLQNYKQVAAVCDGKIGEQIGDDLNKEGMILLHFWDNGFRHITNNVRPISIPEDLKGLKIRTPEDEMTLAIFKALGANPAPLAFSELYMALQQKVFDGQENPSTNIYHSKFFEVQKYLSLTGHKYETSPFIVSPKTWKKLSKEEQEILTEAAVKYGVKNRAVFKAQDEKYNKELGNLGMKVNEADTAAFQKASQAVYTEYRGKCGDAFIDELIETVKNTK
jgi:tripartite ATP-independent transporter DctP family solute receptor